MSLRDRLAGIKPNGPRPAGSAAPAAPAVPQTIDPSDPMAGTGARAGVTPASARTSGMYARRGEEAVLSAVDQLKVDLHRRLIERLDLEALEQVKDET